MVTTAARTAPTNAISTSAWVFLVLAFGISWGAIALLVGPSGIPATGDAAGSIYPLVFVAMAAGPPLAALICTIAAGGWAGLRDLLAHLANWRAAPRDYLVALLLVPATIALTLAIASSISPAFVPAVFGEGGGTILVMGIVFGLAAGFFEEIGWTGFAGRRFIDAFGVLKAGLFLGTIHGIWHLLAGFWGEGAHYGWLYLPYYVLLWIVGLIALRLLILWLYERTGSVPVAQLAHASYTGGLFILWPGTRDPLEITIWAGAFAVVLLVVVLVLIVLSRSALMTPSQAAASR